MRTITKDHSSCKNQDNNRPSENCMSQRGLVDFAVDWIGKNRRCGKRMNNI